MRVLAIGDIHGCAAAFDTVLQAAAPAPEDLLITLGDYVDRGPDSRGVIERLRTLDRTHRLVPLRGNHELMMLDARTHELEFWCGIGGRQTLDSYAPDDRPGEIDDVPSEHWEFVERRCVDYHETETHIFTHAGLQPDVPLAEQEEYDLFWQKLTPGAARGHVSGKTVICGHTAQTSGEPLNLGHTICVDTWVYGDGWLTCLDVGSDRYWQARETGEVREGAIETP